MKKSLFFTMLFLCLFIFISNVQAIPCMYIIEGTMEKSSSNLGDSYGWDGKQYKMTVVIDSSATEDPGPHPSYWVEPFSIYQNVHWQWDIDGQSYSGDEAAMVLDKGDTSVQDDFLRIAWRYSDLSVWGTYNNLDLYFPYCTLDNVGDIVSPCQSLVNSDVSSGSVWMGSKDAAYTGDVDSVRAGAVPEPTTMLLFGAGLVGLAGFGRKKFKN